MRASQAEDTAGQAFEEVGHMRDTVADLKERLVQVISSPGSRCQEVKSVENIEQV